VEEKVISVISTSYFVYMFPSTNNKSPTIAGGGGGFVGMMARVEGRDAAVVFTVLAGVAFVAAIVFTARR
jgi:hypothetical protein